MKNSPPLTRDIARMQEGERETSPLRVFPEHYGVKQAKNGENVIIRVQDFPRQTKRVENTTHLLEIRTKTRRFRHLIAPTEAWERIEMMRERFTCMQGKLSAV